MLDWDDLRSFLTIARHGNLSAATRPDVPDSQTVSRRRTFAA